MVRIFCKNTGTFKEFPEGTTLQDIAPQFEFDKPSINYPINIFSLIKLDILL